MRPEMMAIGDSGYNGVRSLTINRGLAAHSVPAQVARAFGWPFAAQDYPRAVLADFELVARRPELALHLVKDALTNARAWLNDAQWAAEPVFHNLSIAQQVIADPADPVRCYDAQIAVAKTIAFGAAAPALKDLPNLYQALNTSFVLNPQRKPGRGKMTAVDIVAEQNPRRLLIHIGPNDGLWTLLLMADGSQDIDPTQGMVKLVAALKAKCGGVERFFVNLLPKPSSIAY